MGMIKWIVILVVVLLILGLYYYTDQTKEFMRIAGKTTMEIKDKLVDSTKGFVEEGGLENVEDKIKEASGS